TADALLARGDEVVALDVLHPQVHGENAERPGYLHSDVELVHGDARDAGLVGRLVSDADVVFCFAAHTGGGQSMYQPREYYAVNVVATATLLEAITEGQHHVQRLVVASSRAVYGEGAYACPQCGMVTPASRSAAQLAAGQWEPVCPSCDHGVTAIA